MELNKNLQEKIDDTLNAFDAIEEVNVSPFLKGKTMQRLFPEKDEKQWGWSWFTPKLQLITLACIVILNIVAFTKLQDATYDENVSEFAESFGLSTTSETSIFN